MQVFPDEQTFKKKYERGEPQVMWTSCLADTETPVSAMIKIAQNRPNSFLLESVEGGTIRGRYSFIGLKPDLIWRCFGNHAEINRSAIENPNKFTDCPIAKEHGTLRSLRALREESRINMPNGMPPMSSGLVGYMAYDMVRLAEDIPNRNPAFLDVPDSIFLRPTVMAVFDALEDSLMIVTPVWSLKKRSSPIAYDEAKRRLEEVVLDFDGQLPLRRQHDEERNGSVKPVSNISKNKFLNIVKKAINYIRAGDAFQIVVSQRFSLPFSLSPFSFYRSLRRLNPSPFLFFLNFGNFSIVGSSPEILVRVRDGQITVRPLAGTRKRGDNFSEDEALAKELLSDPKELAEHLMLLDLARNDVGKVSKIGSVKPTEKFFIEYYSHVMHIASNVNGQLDVDRFDPIDALFSGFPAGTLSGAPKVRAMEIIDELEPERRGVYGGCIGYFGADGNMDTCIALRTAVLKDKKLYIQAGCGIVADSNPELEYLETINKARALVLAAEEASRFS